MLGDRPTEPTAHTADSAPKPLRLFVAIDIPPDVKRVIILTIEGLQRTLATPSLRWIRSEGIHATIKFLGATPEDRLPEIKQALARCAEAAAPFDLTPLGVGSFGGRNVRIRIGAGDRPSVFVDPAGRLHRHRPEKGPPLMR